MNHNPNTTSNLGAGLVVTETGHGTARVYLSPALLSAITGSHK